MFPIELFIRVAIKWRLLYIMSFEKYLNEDDLQLQQIMATLVAYVCAPWAAIYPVFFQFK